MPRPAQRVWRGSAAAWRPKTAPAWSRICAGLLPSIFPEPLILHFLLTAALRMPKLAIAAVFLVLAALAGTMSYAGFLVVGVLADYLGTGRVVAALLLGALFARFPWVSKGKLRIVGVLPKPIRRPVVLGLLALGLLHFLRAGDYLPVAFIGFAAAFVLAYPWVRRAMFARIGAAASRFAGRRPAASGDGMVIDAEFKERKD